MNASRKRQLGFTLIELLVVIAIIGVLIGLLLPAVQKVREAAARAKCQNNLKQVGLAYLNYESANGGFAPAYYSGQIATQPAVGWGYFLLPFIEQQNLYANYNPNFAQWVVQVGPPAVNNQAVSSTQIPILNCPSSPTPAGPYALVYPNTGNQTVYGYPSDYMPFSGPPTTAMTSPAAIYSSEVTVIWNGSGTAPNSAIGALVADAKTKILSILDGTSNTILICEAAGRPGWYENNKPVGTITGNYGGFGGWADPGSAGSMLFGSDSTGTSVTGQCVMNCSNDFDMYAFHGVGANACFCDGSVHFLTTTVNPIIIGSLLTARGGEVTTNFGQ